MDETVLKMETLISLADRHWQQNNEAHPNNAYSATFASSEPYYMPIK